MKDDEDALRPHKIVSVGIDWLTATAYRTREHEGFQELGSKLLSDVKQQGNDERLWKARGYHGKHCAGVRCGIRADTHLIQLSGDDAHEHWKEVAQLSTNISRLDVEVTLQFESADSEFIQRQSARAQTSKRRRCRTSNVTLITSTLTGDSLYLGQRSSDLYLRCYDKGRESKTLPAGLLIRQEAELKRDRAKSFALELIASPESDRVAGAFISSLFRRRGIQTAMNYEEYGESARAKSSTDQYRKLCWLKQAVAPSVRSLLESGKGEEVLRALGLDSYCVLRRASALTVKRKEDKDHASQ